MKDSQENPQISVIVPIYNVEKWLDRCLKSIINQQFKDFELILVNDGSTDNSLNICKKYLIKDSRIKLFSKKNGGLSDARNYGLRYASGKYVVFVDSDDYVLPNYLEMLIESIKYNHSEVAICEYNLVSESGNFIRSQRLNEPKELTVIDGRTLLIYYYKDGGSVNVVAWNKIYRRELFNNIKFAKGKFYEDEYLLVPMFWRIKKVSLVRKKLYNYVQRPNSIMSTPLNIDKIMDIYLLKWKRIKFFSKTDNEELYMLAIQDFKNWLMSVNKEEVVQKSDKLNFQKQYRQLVRKKRGITIKDKIKDVTGYINLNLLYNLNILIHKGKD